MSILIRGIDMPNERENFRVTIKYNGIVLDTDTEIQVAEAQEIFPHGDLIDRDALIKKKWDADTRCGYVQVVDVGDIINAPVVIEAEEKK